MSSILDLFSNDFTEVKFDISGTQGMYQKIKRMQDSVGGVPHLVAKVGAGGINQFLLSNGNKEVAVSEFSGVIIANHNQNALFPKGEMNASPMCSSVDGVVGVNRETGECMSCQGCPNNEFGSDGNGKKCKNMHKLYVLAENCAVPITVSIPPTSLENWRNYALSSVAVQGRELNEVVTKFTLSSTVSHAGNKYSLLNFEMLGYVSEDVKQFCGGMTELVEQKPRAVLCEDYNREPAVIEQTQDFDDNALDGLNDIMDVASDMEADAETVDFNAL